MLSSWIFLQLADSAFPTGGFAHSGGLEAALHMGEVKGASGLEKFLSEAIWQIGYGVLPLANAAFENPDELQTLDSLCEVFLTAHVANRASRVQGRTFLSTCVRSLGSEGLRSLDEEVKAQCLHQHYAPIFGTVMKILKIERLQMQQLLIHGSFRGMISAAVRLGVVGPYQGQQIQTRFAGNLIEVQKQCENFGIAELAQTAPLLELFQSKHDCLYSKLFQS